MITPLAPTLPPLGAGAQMMPLYYLFRNPLFFVYLVIPPYRNRGALTAGWSPWSVRFL